MDIATTPPRDASQRSTFWADVHVDHDVDGVSWWQSSPSSPTGLVAFGPGGPTTCSGPPIVRHTHTDLAAHAASDRTQTTPPENPTRTR